MQGLNSPNEDQTQGPCIGSTESTTGRPGNSLVIFLNGSWPHIFSVKSQLVSFADASPGLFVVWLSLAGAWNGNSKGNIFKWNSFSPARRRGWKDPGNHRRLVCRGSAARVSMNQGSRDPRRWMRLEAEPSCQFLPFPAGYLQQQQIPGALGQGFPALSTAPARSPQHLVFGVSSGESRAVGSDDHPSHLAADMITVDLLSAFRKQISRGFWVVREEPTQTQIFQLYIRNRRPRSFKKIDWISRGNKYMGSTESIVSRSGCLQVCSRPNHFQHHKSPTAYSVAAVYPHFQKPYRASPHQPPTPPALVQMQEGSLPVLLKISCPSHVYQLPSLFNYWLISFLWPWRPSSLSWSHRLPCSFLPALPTPDISLSLWPQMRWGQADLPLT